ncbi:MAG: cation-translocating P-type ATPase C-terminal domain-containing protein, partial [Oscillospiraceae bacterium]
LLLLPLHVVLLELLIDPTCSIVLERQPAETDIMERKPRNPNEKLLTPKTLLKSILQGLVIFGASFGAYYFILGGNPENASIARSMGIAIIMFSNLFLVQVNSSDHDFAFRSVMRLAKDKVMWVVNFGTLAMLLAVLYTPLNGFLKLSPLPASMFFAAAGIAIVAVFWYELVKLFQRIKHN